MNFFSVGFVLLSVQLGSDMPINYILKLIGVGFMLGGIKEAELFSKDFHAIRPLTLATGAAGLLGLAGAVLIHPGSIGGFAARSVSALCGTLCTLLILLLQYRLAVKLMLPRHELVNDTSLLKTLVKKWQTVAFFTAVSAVCDILQRLLPEGTAQAVAGSVFVISRLIMLVCAVFMATAFNRVRQDFNATHPI